MWPIPSQVQFRIEEKIHSKAVASVSRGAEGRSFGSCSTWETNGLPGGTGIVQAEIMASGETVPDLDQNLIMAICTVLF